MRRTVKSFHAPASPRAFAIVVLLALPLFAAVAYGPALRVPFIGDDYVFLDKTRNAPFAELWSRANTDFGWYRPWSREVHFWLLEHLFGPHEPVFHAANLVLWLCALGCFWVVLRHRAGDPIAAVAVLGVACLSLWGAPLTWISGAQDLWMLVFAMLALLLDDRRRIGWALLAHAMALLSKESAAAFPIVLLARSRFLEGLNWRAAAWRVLPFVLVTLAWLWVHPALLHRLAHPTEQPTTGDRPLAPWEIAARSLLSLVNLDRLYFRIDPDAWRPVATVVSALILAAAAFLVARMTNESSEPKTSRPSRGAIVAFGAVWCVAGWAVLFSPSIGWHAYYGSLGTFGAWICIAVFLAGAPRLAPAVLLALGLVRGAAAATRSWDWGSEWYQTRAGNMLHAIRTQLLELHPTLPRHSRLYFGSIPNNVGLIAGRSPAVRVWYADPTLEAGFYSYYRPRSAGEPPGADYFFHFDSTTGIREVRPDSPPPLGLAPGSTWEQDHESLAIVLLMSGDAPQAARMFEFISMLSHRPDALLFAGTCWEVAGDSVRAGHLFEAARVRTGATAGEIRVLVDRLRSRMPGRRPSPN